MSDYRPPVDEMMFVLESVTGFDGLKQLEGIGASDIRLALDSAAKLASEVLAPLNHAGDREASRCKDGAVTTPKGFKEAYAQYRDGGWNGVPFDPDYGGQGLPWMVAFAIQEMWQSANMSFGLCPMLNQAAVEAIANHGTPEQKRTYLAKLVSGEWTGTMNLTEPQAGSDLGALTAKAEKQADGTYLIRGQKIFITYGEHDLAENIIHTVLARVSGSPDGVKGISMFVVPKFIPDAKGNPGRRNDIKCVSIEHKMGIHASPTCTLQYGDEGGAVGWLIGRENEGLKYMFTMMNNARLSVGLQGVALAERAYQHALSYANERVQGTSLADKNRRVPIVGHADVRRMLLSMKSQVMAGRMLAYEAAKMMDLSHAGDAAAKARVELLTPVVKAWCTDMAVEVASLGVQVHGGMGFIEETGAAQYYRDARILPIYEGTNGIQALDLSMRKVLGDKGSAAQAFFADVQGMIDDMKSNSELAVLRARLHEGLAALREATVWILDAGSRGALDDIAAVNVPFLKLFGNVAGGAMHARAALKSKDGHVPALFFATHILPQCAALKETVISGSAAVMAWRAGC